MRAFFRRHRRSILLLGGSVVLLVGLVLLRWAFWPSRPPLPPGIGPPITAHRDPAIVPRRERSDQEGPCAIVLGFLPHWVDRSSIRHDLLTDIACFAIEFNPDGSVKNAHGWPWIEDINRAHEAGVRVHITAQLFGGGDLLTLLTDAESRSRFHHAIGTAAVVAGIDGVMIDFEGNSNTGWAAQMADFAADLRVYLDQEAPGTRLSFAVPAVNWGGHWDLPALAEHSDHLFIMAYDYHGRWSERAGPSSPLTGGAQHVTRTIERDYAAVGEHSPQKLILGLPHYGNHWIVKDGSPGAVADRWVRAVSFSAAQRLLERGESHWDPVSQTPVLTWRDREGWHQVWFEDAKSFRLKADLARQHGLGGIGIWALGFTGSHPDMWREIERLFVTPCRCIGDLNGDGRVDGEDLRILLEAFGQTDAGDLNGDGVTDLADLLILLDNYPSRCEE